MRKLFTLLSAVLISAAAMAQSWDFPEMTKATSIKTDGTTEYFLSVTNAEGESYWYGKGNDWGTRTSVKMSEEEALIVRFTTPDANGLVRFNNYVSDKGGWAAFVDCDGGLSAWVDGQGRDGDGKWKINDLGNGQIELTNLQAGKGEFKFGVSFGRLVWDIAEQDYVPAQEGNDALGFDNRCYFIGSNVNNVNMLNEDGDSIGVTPSQKWEDSYTTWQLWDASLYNTRMEIINWYYDIYPEYQGNKGVDDAVNTLGGIYDKADATVEDLQAAFADVKKAVTMIAIMENAELLEGASAEEPLDLFEMGIMVNPDFGGDKSQGGDLEGWNAQLRGLDNHRQADSYSNGNVSISGFAESWTWDPSHGSGYGEFTQQASLPAGLYILGVDMIATHQQGSNNKADSKGVELFALSTDGEEYAIPVATGNNAPEHFELSFTTEGGAFTLGIRENNTTCNWIAMDNWTMKYYGQPKETVAQLRLREFVTSIEEQYDNLEEVYANQAVCEDYEKVFEEVRGYAEAAELSDEDCQLFTDSLQRTYDRLIASINDYKVFAQRMEEVLALVEEYKESNPELAAEIEEYYGDVLQVEYDERNWTREEINYIYGAISKMEGKYNGEMKPGDDVSYLLRNPKFQSNFTGWNIEGTSPWWAANHGQGANAHADLCQEVPDEDDGLAECFHAVFDMSQTIYNLPAGLYTLSVQGFNRHDDGNNQSAQLYATFNDGTEQVQDFASIDEYKTEERLYVVGTLNEETGEVENIQWMSDAGRDGDTYWVPNGMSGSAWHFRNKSDGENYDYTSKFRILMKQEGDLKVGVRVANDHQWVIFDNFTLVYEGQGAAVWTPAIEEEIAALKKASENDAISYGLVMEFENEIKKANAFIAAMTTATTVEACQEIIAEMQALRGTMAENIAAKAQVESLYDTYLPLYDEMNTEDAIPAALMEEATKVFDIISEFAFDDYNTEELHAFYEKVNKLMTEMKLPENYQDASDENPIDMTKIINNPQFNVDGIYYEADEDGYVEEPDAVQNHTFNEWTGNIKPGTGGGQAANIGEIWNAGEFDYYQELIGMPAGTYVVACQGFVRHGNSIDDSYKIYMGEKTQEIYAYLYATTAEGDFSAELNNIASVQLTQQELDSLGITGETAKFNSNTFTGPNQLSSADGFFKNGYYNSEVTVKVAEDGKLRIGIKKINKLGNDWVVVDNMKLTYLGNGSKKELSGDDATAIDIVEAPAQKAIYTITGVRVSNMSKPGLYIINGVKVLVK